MKIRDKKFFRQNSCMIILGAGIYIGSLFCVLIMAMLKDVPQEYNHFIVENLAILGANKSNELKIFYLYLMIIIANTIIIGYLCGTKIRKVSCSEKDCLQSQSNYNIWLATVFVCASLVSSILGGFQVSFVLILFSVVGILACIKRNDALSAYSTWIILFSALCGMLQLFNQFLLFKNSINSLVFVTTILTICWLLFSEKLQNRIIIILQFFVPFSVLIYDVSYYHYHGQYLELSHPIIYRIFIWTFIVLMEIIILNNSIRINRELFCSREKVEKKVDYNLLVSKATCVSIAVFSTFSGAGLIISDRHHPGEMMISFTQIFQKGLTPYEDYFPVSGLFSVVIGAINELFGKRYCYASLSASVICLFVALVTTLLLFHYFEKRTIILLVFLFIMAQAPYIARTQLILSLLLLVLLPYKSCFRQLVVYVACCLLMGLYYPLYGVAFMCGLMPYEFYQILKWIKNKNVENKKITGTDLLCCLLLGAVILFLFPTLLGMLKHILIYSSQSLLADGFTVMGNDVPERFLPFMKTNPGVRLLVYDSIWYFVPVFFVVTFVFFAVYLLGKHKKDAFHSVGFYLSLFVVFYSLISFSYSQMRVETDGLLGRTVFVLFPLLPVIFAYVIKKTSQYSLSWAIVAGIFVAIAIQYGASVFSNINEHMLTFYEVEDSFVYYEDNGDNLLGTCFVSEKIENEVNEVVNIRYYFEKEEQKPYYTGMYFAQLYAADLKTIGQPSIFAMKSKEATWENLEQIMNKEVVIADKMTTYGQYCWNRFLLTSNQIYYLENQNVFVTKALAGKLKEATLNKSNYYYNVGNMGAIANTLGKSFDAYGAEWLEYGTAQINDVSVYLDGLETGMNQQTYILTFDEPIVGAENDFLYLKMSDSRVLKKGNSLEDLLHLSNNSTDTEVYVAWETPEGNQECIAAYFLDGYLLFPLGMNSTWFTSEHDQISIMIVSSKQNLDAISLETGAFYRLIE